MGHHFVLALCVAYVLLLRVACAPCPIVDSWFQALWTCDPFLLDAHFEVFAGSSSDPFAHFAASVGAISARSPLSWCRLPAALPCLRAALLTLSRARSPLTPALRAARVLASSAKCCYSQAIWPFLVNAMVKMEQNKHGARQRCNEMFITRRNFGKRAWSPWSKAAWSLATP